MYISLAGTPSHTQPLTVQRLVSRLRPERIVLGNDNDPMGIYYNTLWLAQLNPARTPVGVGPVGRVLVSERKCTLLFDGLPTGTPQTEAYIRYWQQGVAILNKGYEGNDQRAKLEVVGGGPSAITQLRLDLPKQRPFLIRLEKMIADFRGLTQVVGIKRPIEKDWNDQLKQSQQESLKAIRNSELSLKSEGEHPRTFPRR